MSLKLRHLKLNYVHNELVQSHPTDSIKTDSIFCSEVAAEKKLETHRSDILKEIITNGNFFWSRSALTGKFLDSLTTLKT